MKRRISPVDLRLQVLAVMLEPPLTLARIMALPLDDLQRVVATGYYREARRRKLTQAAIAKRFKKSLRTIATLAKEAESDRPILARSEGAELRRRIVEAISKGEQTLESLQRRLPKAALSVSEALDDLVDEGILERRGDRWVGVTRHFNVVHEEAEARLDSLRHFLGAVTKVVYSRFFNGDGETGFARVLTFATETGSLHDEMKQRYADLRDAAIRLDGEAGESAPHASVAMCYVEEPTDHHWKERSTG